MDTIFKVLAVVIITVILSVSLPKNVKDFSVVMIIGACTCLVIVICSFLEPIISVFRTFADMGNIDNSLLEILLKTIAVAVLSEFVALVCSDSGNAAMGKGVQIFASVVVLWLSLPLFTSLIEIINNTISNS